MRTAVIGLALALTLMGCTPSLPAVPADPARQAQLALDTADCTADPAVVSTIAGWPASAAAFRDALARCLAERGW